MKRIVLLLSITAMIFSFQDSNAQSLRQMVKKRIFKEPVEIQNKEDSMTVVEIDNASESSTVRISDGAMMDAFGLTDNVDYESGYSFDSYIQMEITNYKKNGNVDDKVLYDSYIHKDDADYAMVFSDDGDKSTIIFDSKNSAMLILTDSDGEKNGFATTVDPEAMAAGMEDYDDYEDEDVDMEPLNYKKTGKSKKILGYHCEEYLLEDEESEVHMWSSEKLGKEMRKEWMNNQQTFGAMFTQAYAVNGMVLEYDVLDKDNGEKTIMLVTKIDMNHNHKVSTAGYSIISMRQKTIEE